MNGLIVRNREEAFYIQPATKKEFGLTALIILLWEWILQNFPIQHTTDLFYWIPRKKIPVAFIRTKEKIMKADTRCFNYLLLLKAKLFFPIPVLILKAIGN